jgi:uncharacterized protein YlxW (UPF0749 family)
MDKILKDITKLRDSIVDAEKSLATLKGREEELLNQLKSAGFKSEKEARKFIEDNEDTKESLADDIKKKYDSIKGQYEW